jgi:hypothetical protein
VLEATSVSEAGVKTAWPAGPHGEQHIKRKEARRICIIAFDYLFLDEPGNLLERDAISNGANVDLASLVAKGLKGKAILGHVVPQQCVDK